jgi:hypothetical protein
MNYEEEILYLYYSTVGTSMYKHVILSVLYLQTTLYIHIRGIIYKLVTWVFTSCQDIRCGNAR